MLNAQRIEQLREASSDVTTADDANREFLGCPLQTGGVGIETGDDVFGNWTRVAAGGIAEGNARCGQRCQINVINPSRGATHETQTTAPYELCIDRADRAY